MMLYCYILSILNAALISGDKINTPGAIAVSSLEDVKGFEFKTVIIVGLDQMWFPPTERHKDEVWRDALRLYVAMTRARDHVYMLYQGTPSPFLEKMREEIQWRDEQLIEEIIPEVKPLVPKTECPHCLTIVSVNNLQNHVTSKCIKRPGYTFPLTKGRKSIMNRVSLNLFRDVNEVSIRCRDCGKSAIPGNDRCYSCGN